MRPIMKGKQMAISLSRTAIEQFIRCPKCFYFHRKLGLKPPSLVPLTLTVAIKNEDYGVDIFIP